MKEVCQGDVLHVEGVRGDVFVVSKNVFNKTGMIVGCPFVENAEPGPLHILVSGKKLEGTVLCEQLKSLDINSRGHSKRDEIKMIDVMEVSDAVQGIFDYIM